MTRQGPHIAVIGAGIAGLAASLRLSARGHRVTLIERHEHLGGKIRTVPSAAGPVAAGPTVLTMRDVFDDLFAAAGARLDDHVTLIPQKVLARHFWPDGSRLDLTHNPIENAAAIHAFAGPRAAEQFRAFDARAKQLFAAFDAPMMRAANPSLIELTRTVVQSPTLIRAMAPLSTLKDLLTRSFDDPRLRQLFGRYATYVGGAPGKVPALLALIWQAEAAGVWTIEGGLQQLAYAIAELAQAHGTEIMTGTHVDHITLSADRVSGVQLVSGQHVACDAVLFAGDPRALGTGALGLAFSRLVREVPRSLSARVHSFAARPEGPELAHHNVLFDHDPDAEFDALSNGEVPRDPSIYICAMDRGLNQPPADLERFEIITNAPPLGAQNHRAGDLRQWHETIIQKMTTFGITFQPIPSPDTVTTESDFATLFPESLGALYGQSPHGLTASLARPRARTPIPGLYLAGGGCHPGAGVPMATLSGQHAAEAILHDRISASASRPMAMPGGISTG